MKLLSCWISLSFLLLSLTPLQGSQVAPQSGTSETFKIVVSFKDLKLPDGDGPRCATYHKGALIHQQHKPEENYVFHLPLAYLTKELWVNCQHPNYEDSGGGLEPAVSAHGLQTRYLVVKFTRPKLIQDVRVKRENSKISAIQFKLRLPQPHLLDVDVPGAGSFKKLHFPDVDMPLIAGSDFEGTPEVPVAAPLLALPRGASIASIQVAPGEKSVFNSVRLVPVSPSRAESPDYVNAQTQTFNSKVYESSRIHIGAKLYEEAIDAGNYKVIKLALHLVSYDAKAQELTVPSSVDVTINLKNAGSCYSFMSSKLNPVEFSFSQRLPELVQKAINFPDVQATPPCIPPRLPNLPIPVPQEIATTDYVILSHSTFMAAAETLASHKRDLGWATQVLLSDGRDLETIKESIQKLRPQWLLIFGDAEFIGTYYHSRRPYVTNRFDNSFAAGDTYYAQGPDDRLNPGGFSIGRLPVDTAAEASKIVNRIIAYERNPNMDSDFYENPLWLAHLSYATDLEELYRNETLNFGVEPLRFYVAGGRPIPEEFRAIPSEKIHWEADAAQINQRLNMTSAAVVLHRGHANWHGWQSPPYSTADINDLQKTASRSPFVLSINCSSGFFDNETAAMAVPPREAIRGSTPYGRVNPKMIVFAEKFIRNDDGAIGVIADTRPSDTDLNNALAKGAILSIYKDADTLSGSMIRGRLGQILLDAKAEVINKSFPLTEMGTQLLIYNLLGDPGVYLHRRPPYLVGDLTFDRQNNQGKFKIYDTQCSDCLFPEMPRSTLMVSVRRLNGDRSILARTFASTKDGKTYSFDFGARNWTADELQITVSGPALRPAFLKSGPVQP